MGTLKNVSGLVGSTELKYVNDGDKLFRVVKPYGIAKRHSFELLICTCKTSISYTLQSIGQCNKKTVVDRKYGVSQGYIYFLQPLGLPIVYWIIM